MSRSKSSKAWLKEHFKDSYVKESKAKGYRARSVYKLLEIQQRDKIIKPGMVVVDLGAAPGSWSQLVVKLVGQQGKVFAVDILPMEPIEGVEFIQGDFTEQKVLDQLLEAVKNHTINLVISDMAPNISGIESVDQAKSMLLAELALETATQLFQA